MSAPLVVVTAYGAWHWQVPAGSVAVEVAPHGDRSAPRSAWLVPHAEYRAGWWPRFVVDPSRHKPLPDFRAHPYDEAAA